MRAWNLGRARALSAVTVLGAGAALLFARDARATSVLEIGDNGSEQMGRGGAWVARASDPLAAFYNPAGLAGQDTKLTLQANINLLSTCFTRLKAMNDTTSDGINGGQSYPQVCSNNAPFPDPQIAFTYKVNDRLGLGIAVLGPSAAGNQAWPSTIGNNQPSPQRYLLLSANTLLFTPSFAVGWEPIDRLRVGASFLWGIANFDFTNDSYAVNADDAPPRTNDVKGELKVKNLFVPGFTLGTIWSPIDNLDIAGWYKWLDPITATGDVTTLVNGASGGSALANCGLPSTAAPVPAGTCGPNKTTVTVTVPMEAKVGFRYHMPRAGVEQAHRRDPLSQDVFDVEADLTWANDSAFQTLGIAFPGDANGNGLIPVNGAVGGTLPPNASVPHQFSDVYGVRLGGDYNVIPDKLAIRAGGYFETAAVSAQYLNIDFAGEQRIGLAAGATYRVRLGDEPKHNALEFMVGLGHTFIASLTNPGQSGIEALAGTACNSAGTPPPGNVCSNGNQKYRTNWAVNLGTVTNAFTQINVGASYRF